MNDPYNKVIIVDGKQYRWDADYDCYHRVYEQGDLTHLQQFGWIYTIILLAIIAWAVSP